MSETPPSNGWLHGLTDGLLRWRRWLLLGAALLTLLGLVPASRLRFDQSIESFYASDNPHLQAYLESKSLFGGDQFVIVAFEDPQLFTPEGVLSKGSAARIREFAARLSNVPGVEAQGTQNLADALAVERFPLMKKQRILMAMGSQITPCTVMDIGMLRPVQGNGRWPKKIKRSSRMLMGENITRALLACRAIMPSPLILMAMENLIWPLPD